MPDEAEPTALLALMLLHHARRAARTGADGALVLLGDQDRARWDREAIGAAPPWSSARCGCAAPGPYALQAAIAALHAEAPAAADTDWPQIAVLYDELRRVAPSPVVDPQPGRRDRDGAGPAAGLDAGRRGRRRPARRLPPAARRSGRPAAAARPGRARRRRPTPRLGSRATPPSATSSPAPGRHRG